MKTEKHDAIVLASASEKDLMKRYVDLFRASPLPNDEVLPNLGLFLTSKALSRVLFFDTLYRKVLGLHGIVVEFGVRWGQTLSLLSALRGVYEPFNRHRKIVGFDTFSGFKGVSDKDGQQSATTEGSFSVPDGYERYLDEILGLQEALNPAPHLRKYELVKGDAVETVPAYLRAHPETIISMAIFDFDIYTPTRAALEAIQPHLAKGSLLVFDELADPYFPGETLALREVLGIRNVRIQRLPITARISYIEVE
jgi:hypothetical protein